MRKSILLVAAVLGMTSTFAQDLTSRKGENYLPQAGDWAIGIDAVPLLDYVGNIFGKSNDNGFAGNIWTPNTPSFTLHGKYFLEDGLAFRGGLRLGFNSSVQKEMVADRSVAAPVNDPWPGESALVENKFKNGSTNVGLTFGIEKRKGNTRLQGFYGAEIGFLVNSNTLKYTYGNALTDATATIPVEVDGDDDFFTGNIFGGTDGDGNAITYRMLTEKSGVNFSLGLRAFIGAEYFIIPKLSIGGEFGWGLVMSVQGKSKQVAETVGTVANGANAVVTEIEREGTSRGMSLGLDNSIVNPLFGPVGRLNLTFHF